MSEVPTPGPLAVEARGIERRFGRFVALAGVDLEVPAASTLALFGPNGAGKTTLLRILARLLRPTAGTVRVCGFDLEKDPARALATLGFLSHEPALYGDLTPAENLRFSARLHALDGVDGRIQRALQQVSLERRDMPVRALSRGLQQRAALARALIHEPRLILLDEPWTGLDPAAQKVLADRLAAHRSAGGTAILTTHDIRQGYAAADRVALLSRGRIVLAGTTVEHSLAALESAFARAVEEATA